MLLDEELREIFVHIDFTVMRVALWTTNIPPPKNEVDDTAEIEVNDYTNMDLTNALLNARMRRYVEDASKDRRTSIST